MFTPPTRSEKISWSVFYGIITAAGLIVLTVPPRTIEGPLGEILTPLWGLLLTVAVVPTISSLNGRFKWEYVSLPPIMSGVTIYAATVWYITATDTPTRAAQAALITALAVGLGRRWLDRRALVRQDRTRQQRADPESQAG